MAAAAEGRWLSECGGPWLCSAHLQRCQGRQREGEERQPGNRQNSVRQFESKSRRVKAPGSCRKMVVLGRQVEQADEVLAKQQRSSVGERGPLAASWHWWPQEEKTRKQRQRRIRHLGIMCIFHRKVGGPRN